MKLEQSFEVAAPLDDVWKLLIDVERVAPCLPGADIHRQDDEGTWHGTFTVKLGPTTASYIGTLRIEDADDEAKTATLKAKGTDKRGQGGASATIHQKLVPSDSGGTHVDSVADLSITGKLARFGRGGMIQDVSNRMLQQFATNLQDALAGAEAAAPADEEPAPAPAAAAANGAAPPPPEPNALDAGELVAGMLADRVKRYAPVLVAAAIGVVLLTLLRRARG